MPVSSRFVRSAEHLDADMELKADIDVNINFNGKAKSETGMNAEGREHLEVQWVPRKVQSDSGVDMGRQKHGETMMHQKLEMARVQEEHQADKNEQDTDVDYGSWMAITEGWGEERSPPISPEIISDDATRDHDHKQRWRDDRPCLPIIIMLTPTRKSSVSAALDQGLKPGCSPSTAVPSQAYET